MEFKKLPIATLIPAAYNPRKDLQAGDSEFEKIRHSIEEFGYVDPIIVNSDMTIIGGHQRVKVLSALGQTEIDCVIVEVDKTKEKALNIALNKISGDWDEEKLVELIEELKREDYDLELTGFSDDEISKLISEYESGQVKEDDFNLEEALDSIEEPITKTGDVWIIGKQRLICGDSTSPEVYVKLMQGEKANIVVTDPPYNVNYEGKAGKIENDNISDSDFYSLLNLSFENMFNSMADGAAIYVFHSDTEGQTFRKAFSEAGFHLANVCVWVKNSLVMGRSDYQWQHEPILYGWKPTSAHNWYSDRKQTTVWEFDRPMKSDLHPTMKPIALCSYPIMNSSMENSIVLDGFGGSGSVLITCEQTNRICRMVELDPRYCDVIVKRYIEYMGSGDGVLLEQDGILIKYSDLAK